MHHQQGQAEEFCPLYGVDDIPAEHLGPSTAYDQSGKNDFTELGCQKDRGAEQAEQQEGKGMQGREETQYPRNQHYDQ